MKGASSLSVDIAGKGMQAMRRGERRKGACREMKGVIDVVGRGYTCSNDVLGTDTTGTDTTGTSAHVICMFVHMLHPLRMLHA